MAARLKEKYQSEVLPALMKEFKYPNRMAVPRLSKIVVNMGLGEAIQNVKILDAATRELGQVCGQKPVVTKAKKSIAAFKVREGMPIGCMVTLRGDRMYEFLDRLMNVALPRVRDFRGVPTRSFDGRGNYTLGLRDQLFFATKVWTSGRAEGVRQMEESFRRMRGARMDLMQIHNLLDAATHTRTLEQWKREGRVRYIGITHYTASAYDEVERWLRRGGYDFLQINYSLAERDAERRLLPLAQDMKVAVIANRPFAGAGTFRRVRGRPLPPWAKELGIASWAQYFLKWIIAHPAVTCAIPATSKPEHMQDNLGAAQGALPDGATRDRMAKYFAAL